MVTNLEQPGEILQRHGPVVSRLLRRQFPSLPADVVDSLVVEAIAKVWTRLKNRNEEVSPPNLFALIARAARNRAIDHLRYSPRIVLAAPGALEQSVDRPREQAAESGGALLADLRSEIAELEPLDRRILEAASTPPLAGDWARELAVELIREERASAKEEEIDTQELNRLCGKLRVRKHRVIKALRAALNAQGHDVPESSKVKS